MLALTLVVGMLMRRDLLLLASPYYYEPGPLAADFAVALELDAADARLTQPDDTPLTAAQLPELRDALAADAAARFELAAARLVAFAVKNIDAPESGWALRRAHLYWRGLGRLADAEAALQRYERHHATREPRAAAEFFWSRRLEIPAGPLRRAHIRDYLAQHARHGPPELQLVAEAELAADLWRNACDQPWHGLCVAFVLASRDGPCDPGTVPLFNVRPRDPRMRREALRRATSVGRRGNALDLAHVAPWRRHALRAALGQAALVLADESIEALIALEHPRGLDFFVEDYKRGSGVPRWEREYREQVQRQTDSTTRFTRFWRDFTLRVNAAALRIEAVGATHNAPAILTGMARLAVAFGESWDEQEFALHLPEPFREVTWCEPSDDPLSQIGQEWLRSCSALARASGQSTPEVALCFDGFGRLLGDEDALVEFTGRD